MAGKRGLRSGGRGRLFWVWTGTFASAAVLSGCYDFNRVHDPCLDVGSACGLGGDGSSSGGNQSSMTTGGSGSLSDGGSSSGGAGGSSSGGSTTGGTSSGGSGAGGTSSGGSGAGGAASGGGGASAVRVLINEIVVGVSGYAEIYNAGSTTVDLSGYVIRVQNNFVKSCSLSGTLAPAGFFYGATGTCTGSTTNCVASCLPVLSGGAVVELFDGSQVLDAVTYPSSGGPTAGMSWSTYPDGSTNWDSRSPTPGSSNALN